MSIPPLPCSLRALALNAEDPRFVRTGGFCSSPQPEDSGHGWVLWSLGLRVTPRRAVRRGLSRPRFLPRGALFLLL